LAPRCLDSYEENVMRSWKLLTVVPILLATVLVAPSSAKKAKTSKPAAADTSAAAQKATAPPKHSKPAKAAVPPAPRTAWMLGAGFGFGWSKAYVNGQNPDGNAGGMYSFRTGYAVTNDHIVGIDLTKWSAKPDSSNTPWSVQTIVPTFTWFRGNKFLRLGVGYGSLEAESYGYETVYDFNQGRYVTNRVRVKQSDDGFAWLAAGGYEWRYGKRLGVAPQVQYLHVTAQRALSANEYDASLQLNYYW
jgi:hypothetical protein